MIVRLECTPPKDNADLALGQVMVKSTSAEMGDNEGTLDATVELLTPLAVATRVTIAA